MKTGLVSPGEGRRISGGRRLPAPAAGAAFTLIELLVVLGVMTILLGISIGVYFGFVRAVAIQAETGAVIAVIQSARNTAIDESSETFVCFDAEQGQLYPFGRRKVGVWRFEAIDHTGASALSYGAFGQAAILVGGNAAVTDGRVGKALACDGATHFACKLLRPPDWVNIPQYDAREGVGIEALVAPAPAAPGKMAVVSRDGWFALWLEHDADKARFELHAYAVTLDKSGAGYLKWTASTEPVIRLNEWTHVRMGCHRLGEGVALYINGVSASVVSGSASASSPSAATQTFIAGAGGGDLFNGRIDEVIISAYAVADVHRISRKLRLRHSGLADGDTIRFDASGKLTADHEGAPPQVILQEMKGTRVSSEVVITVRTMGAMDVQTTNK